MSDDSHEYDAEVFASVEAKQAKVDRRLETAHECINELERLIASRDAEVAELVGVLGNVTAHLVAAHSLLSRGGKKAAASDTVFKIMLQDYEKSFEAGRKALAKVRKP